MFSLLVESFKILYYSFYLSRLHDPSELSETYGLLDLQAYDKITTGVLCHGKASDIKEGHKSFPSGHTSCK